MVRETKCIHSTDRPEECAGIKEAETKGYHISKCDYDDVSFHYDIDICRNCYSAEKVASFEEDKAKHTEIMNKIEARIRHRDSLVNSVSPEVREAIIEDYLENDLPEQVNPDDYMEPDPRMGRYY